MRGRYPAVKLELTGETPLNFDIRKASADEVRHAETLVIPATLVLLLVAFGSVVAALIPLAVGELAIATTLAITGFLALRFHLSILVQNLATMLGWGLGIDYALLMVSRFREAIAAGNDGLSLADRGTPGGAHALDFGLDGGHRISGAPDCSHQRDSFHRRGWIPGGGNECVAGEYPCSGGAGGCWVPESMRAGCRLLRGWDAHRAARTGNRWRRWGKVIVAHPWLALFLAGAPLLLLAWQATRLDTSVREGDWLPEAAESVHALHTLAKMGRDGVV